MKPQTVEIVRQGEATLYWFKFNPLYLMATKFPASISINIHKKKEETKVSSFCI